MFVSLALVCSAPRQQAWMYLLLTYVRTAYVTRVISEEDQVPACTYRCPSRSRETEYLIVSTVIHNGEIPSICEIYSYWSYQQLCVCKWYHGNQRDINSLRPSDAMWRLWSWTTLAHVMACCLTAPSHYLNQFWLIIRGVFWGIAQGFNSGYEFEKYILKIIFKSHRGQWVYWNECGLKYFRWYKGSLYKPGVFYGNATKQFINCHF